MSRNMCFSLQNFSEQVHGGGRDVVWLSFRCSALLALTYVTLEKRCAAFHCCLSRPIVLTLA